MYILSLDMRDYPNIFLRFESPLLVSQVQRVEPFEERVVQAEVDVFGFGPERSCQLT